MGNKKTYEILYDSGDDSAKFANSGKQDLEKDDWVTVRIKENQDFPGPASISSVTIYANDSCGGKDTKGDAILTWTLTDSASGSATGAPPYSLVQEGVRITDLQSPTEDSKYWFGVLLKRLDDPDGPGWPLDPELINKKR